MGVHTIVKMNPPMLGKERLEHLLHDTLGYSDLTVNPSAYTSGLQFDESIAMCRRMMDARQIAQPHLRRKILQHARSRQPPRLLPQPTEKVMYLSGAPLHVITLALTDVFRQEMGPEIPISYSAGVDRKNFANMVACGFLPVTTCTDLLKTGGYGRLAPYLQDLRNRHASTRRSNDQRLSSSTPRPARCRRRRPHPRRLAQHVDHRRRNRGRRRATPPPRTA